MATNDYHFITNWRVEGTAEEVMQILADAEALKRWWPSVYLDATQRRAGDERGVGKEVELYTKGWLPYTLRWWFTVVDSDYPHGFTLDAHGDFEGRGIWTIRQDGPWVDVTYDWNIEANKPLLRNFSFVFKPIFAANHRWAMARGEESLRLELARRRAKSAEERWQVPPPPEATSTSPLPLILAIGAATAAATLGVVLVRRVLAGVRSRRRGTAPAFRLNPRRIAHFEAEGWRAYYDRKWLKLLRLMTQLNQEQFKIPFPRSLLGSYFVARAAAAWVPERHDQRKVAKYYEKFYHLARRYSGLRFDPKLAADLETAYNDVHRRLVGAADKSEFVRTMTDLHSVLFGIPRDLARESAELRVLAANVVDQITGKRSLDVKEDWRRLEEYLRLCYTSVQRAMRAAQHA
jgi:hypothetical protein